MQNRGKQFEKIIKESFEKVSDTSVYRLYDTMGGYSSVANIADYVIYHYPYQYFIECKTVLKGNTLSINSNDPKKKYGNISNTQWEGMLEMSKIKGVYCGILCWWVEKDVTKFIPIQLLEVIHREGQKSIRYDFGSLLSEHECPCRENKILRTHTIFGEKKRVFFDYKMDKFFEEFE